MGKLLLPADITLGIFLLIVGAVQILLGLSLLAMKRLENLAPDLVFAGALGVLGGFRLLARVLAEVQSKRLGAASAPPKDA
jgi:hypothetical protein